jgi:hypothetical protein
MAGPPDVCGQPFGRLDGAQIAVTRVGLAPIAIDGPGGDCDPAAGCSSTQPTFAASIADDAGAGTTDGTCSLTKVAAAGAFVEVLAVICWPELTLEHPAPPLPKITRESSHLSAVARPESLRGHQAVAQALKGFRAQLV